ncbi:MULTISPECIES: 16S rRNA (guanine(966)-N(2))-methyltransferase RsmD [Kocuria]|uniref:16S rRNA (guanine(966)-N(2))-methyltransferase RsmD n=1 Tax=Kocuria TaxID=57493 RepID=UPI0006D7A0C1|nr:MULTISPECIES: 16S rRNA (guanine(966)-N(2))-methyltransferase RsmD [Kocuria]MDN5630387.1 16S rRNA (guanine(966)-N(2))-methyltransferase RsmD [Kocuria sp.]RUP84214.1 16S rRNA (guanine(966)-N(2))-methyltransferase RsmD [Kocuria sp. HSID17590]RUQ09178.1 16S rRNA (guanine(966)-N(2))-methyltransferase RsmD [Kocuria sp. HSID17582]
MTRIIAGRAGGQRLKSVPGSATRPTTDRVKESLFARLDAWGMCDGARVLDLFAGSGALGLEAASRGAATVTLVERAGPAARVCRENAATLATSCLDTHITTVQSSVGGYLGRAPFHRWDLVLADPPYPLENDELARTLSLLRGRLGPGGVVVVERSARTEEPAWPAGLRRFEVSDHGETRLWYLEADTEGDADDAAVAE